MSARRVLAGRIVSFGILAASSLFTPAGPAWAHPDLLLQIERLSQQIEGAKAPEAEWFIRRGDLHRRHESWAAAFADFETARTLAPQRADLDWFEGRARVEAGDLGQGIELLSRFLMVERTHAGALRHRALARYRQGDPVAAAGDFSAAILASDSPSPVLYRSWAIAEIHGGADWKGIAAIDRGLEQFPVEVSLLGLAADLALSLSEPGLALSYMARIPEPVGRLPQWQLRQWLAACLGKPDGPVSGPRGALPAARGSQAALLAAALEHLGPQSAESDCLLAVRAMLDLRRP